MRIEFFEIFSDGSMSKTAELLNHHARKFTGLALTEGHEAAC